MKLLPEPDFFIGSTAPCTGGLAAIENLAAIYGKKLYVLQIPQSDTAGNVAFLADQLRGLVEFVVEHTGEALDPGRLLQAVDLSNLARRTMGEVYEAATRTPSPVNGKDLRNYGFVNSLFFGTDAAVRTAQAFKDEFDRRTAAGKSGVPGERFRILWIQNRIQFDNPVVKILEEEYQASIVVDELNAITWDDLDPADPLPGMARRIISIPLNGSVERRLEHMRTIAKKYRVDGAINPCHWGCRQGTGARGLIADGLKAIGVPTLNLEVDCIDARNFSEGQIRTRLQAFMEMLEKGKAER